MDIIEAAKQLDGCEYGNEGSPELFKAMAEVGLVAAFGYSDDNVELRGAVDDEISAYNGTEIFLNHRGIIQNDCTEDCCPYFQNEVSGSPKLKAVWCGEGKPPWSFKTTIPHYTFLVMEDGEIFCCGVVFDLDCLTLAEATQ